MAMQVNHQLLFWCDNCFFVWWGIFTASTNRSPQSRSCRPVLKTKTRGRPNGHYPTRGQYPTQATGFSHQRLDLFKRAGETLIAHSGPSARVWMNWTDWGLILKCLPLLTCKRLALAVLHMCHAGGVAGTGSVTHVSRGHLHWAVTSIRPRTEYTRVGR
jgi:hypothetical protein